MTFQYARLAIGRTPKFKKVYDIELYTEDGRPLPLMSEEEAFYRFGCKKIAEYWIEDMVLHCKLEGVK